jgi:hypothetical protein
MPPVNKERSNTSVEQDLGHITQTTPLRLEAAARLAFPDGSMKLAGLRREIARGRLAYEMIAGKHYTTLSDIEDNRCRCSRASAWRAAAIVWSVTSSTATTMTRKHWRLWCSAGSTSR